MVNNLVSSKVTLSGLETLDLHSFLIDSYTSGYYPR